MLQEYLTIHITCTANVTNQTETLSRYERTENWYLSCRHYHYILRSGSAVITIQREKQREKSNLSLSVLSTQLLYEKRWFFY